MAKYNQQHFRFLIYMADGKNIPRHTSECKIGHLVGRKCLDNNYHSHYSPLTQGTGAEEDYTILQTKKVITSTNTSIVSRLFRLYNK